MYSRKVCSQVQALFALFLSHPLCDKRCEWCWSISCYNDNQRWRCWLLLLWEPKNGTVIYTKMRNERFILKLCNCEVMSHSMSINFDQSFMGFKEIFQCSNWSHPYGLCLQSCLNLARSVEVAIYVLKFFCQCFCFPSFWRIFLLRNQNRLTTGWAIGSASTLCCLCFGCSNLCLFFAWAVANLAELAWHVDNMVKLLNPSQQNVEDDLVYYPFYHMS